MNVGQILMDLKKLGSERDRDGMARFGINTKNAFGVSVYKIRALVKTLKKDHFLAQKLWDTKNHEARILACFVDEPDKVTSKQMDEWADQFDSWDICDLCTSNLFDKTPFAYKKISKWAKSDKEFTRRAAFALLAALSVHDKQAGDGQFIQFFPLIKKYSVDDRNFVKKAVDWSLRNIGKRNRSLNKAAIVLAEDIKKLNTRSGRWIASDVLRELRSEKVQSRLRS